MRVVRAGLRPAFGVFVIAHGLAHAVLPLRGLIDPERLPKDFMPFILYAVAIVGFTIGGLGVLGVRGLAGVVRPMLVVASAYSFVAIMRLGDGGLWWGAAADAVLFIAGLSGAYRYLPEPARHGGLAWRIGAAVAVAFVLYVMGAVVMWPLHPVWGTGRVEQLLTLR